jgi:hypothetical protein
VIGDTQLFYCVTNTISQMPAVEYFVVFPELLLFQLGLWKTVLGLVAIDEPLTPA